MPSGTSPTNTQQNLLGEINYADGNGKKKFSYTKSEDHLRKKLKPLQRKKAKSVKSKKGK